MSYNTVLRGRTSDSQHRDLRLDASTHALEIIDYEHHEIHAGSHYFVGGVQDLSINNVLQFTWQMPNTTKWINWTWRISTESETLWQVYEGAVINNALANAVTPLNSNRNSTNTSGTTMKFEVHTNLAAADVNVTISGGLLLSTGISGSGRDAGQDLRAHEMVLKQNELYVLRATASAAGYINFAMNWYEHTNRGA